uniref:Uncharacterized protein n=1 Tax=Rhizophora mucronata TaxID=61149 RepID=A0A2P2II44_RHIMU
MPHHNLNLRSFGLYVCCTLQFRFLDRYHLLRPNSLKDPPIT